MNQFTVDLGKVQLSEQDKARITAAIQRAVTSELASINLKNQVILIPVVNFKGPIINGIVARHLADKEIGNLIATAEG